MRRPSWQRRWVVVGLAGLLLCSAGAGADAGTTAAAGAASAAALAPCRLKGVEYPALCGMLQRPLDPAAPAGTQIDLHYAVLPALSRNKKPDPVFFFAGGPGQSAIDLAGRVGRLLARFSNRRDIVLIDQRGTGRSAPLKCEDDESPARPLTEMVDPAAVLKALVRCREHLQKLPHGDLRQYTTPIAMQDADAVRRALGAERVNLVGASYGTRAALEYLRQFPRTVRRMVIDGVAPSDMVLPVSYALDGQAAFDALLAWCAADPDCARQHPQLRQRWRSLHASLPREVTLTNPLTGRDETVRLTPELLAGLLRGPLYSPLLASALPLAIEQALAGRWAPLAGLALSAAGGRAGSVAQGMHFSVVCAEDLPLLNAPSAGLRPAGTAAAPDDFGNSLADLYSRACADWPRGQLPSDFYRVNVAASAALLLSGAIDPATPPRHGERMAQALGPLARHVVVPNTGHGVLSLACLRDLAYRFINAEDDAAALALDAGCARALPRPPAFIAPDRGATR